ncbi:MAG: anthranilate synthase component I family protein [Thermodesulfobacteriota bacterium]|nr:anthranilate synthase component I family protein [Thermodesulfobacteriota bacterium]
MKRETIEIARDITDRGVVMTRRLSCDTLTPTSAFDALVGHGQGFLLESIPGEYSFLGRFTDKGIVCANGDDPDPWAEIPPTDAGLTFECSDLPPFIGGYIGYLGYDMVRGIENLPSGDRPAIFPDALLGRVDTFVVFDHSHQRITLVHTIIGRGISRNDAIKRAGDAFKPIEDAFGRFSGMAEPAEPSGCHVRSVSIDDTAFKDAVMKTKTYIREGDIIQAVLSRCMELDTDALPFDTYRRLRRINPSPYLFFIRIKDVTLIGSSPEVMVKLKGQTITSLPIAGTRPRGRDEAEDNALSRDLLGDEKERAEHLMLLDLARNDVGRVSEPGTVQVVSREQVHFYSHVMHIVSRVEGKKRPDLGGMDVIEACFPAGTVSGAPKVRAMEIIDEIEDVRRGPYAGGVGYLSYNGNVDTGIAIRTIFMKGERTFVQAGAGIVQDSIPEHEMTEIDNKLKALSLSLGGIS